MFIFCLAITNVFALDSYAQSTKINIDMDNCRVEDVIDYIEQNSEFFFLYNKEAVDVERIVNIHIKDALINEVLDVLFDHTDISYTIEGKQALLMKSDVDNKVSNNQIPQRQIIVTGKVTDASTDEGLPGVNVTVKGTTIGVMSDFDGNYSINIPNTSVTLQFSFIGYISQEVAVGSKNIIDVKLSEDTQMLDEVVVIGYGVQRKSDITGAISSIKSDDMVNRSAETIGHAIQGKTAGVQIMTGSGAPGTSTSIRVRGFSSNANVTPLYIVDGLKVKSIDYLDMESVESIEILKDAASAAIYGAEAGNGVILITTKSGKSGSIGTSGIFYNMQYTTEQAANFSEVLNAAEYIDFMTEAGIITQEAINTVYDGHTDTNWAKEVFENGITQRHTLGFQGNNDKGSFFLSLTNQTRDGIFAGDKDVHDRLTVQINSEYNIKNWLKVSTTTSLAKTKTSSLSEGSETSSAMSSIILHDPLTPVTLDMNNLPTDVAENLALGKKYLTNENGEIWGMSYINESQMYNPFFFREMNDNYDESRTINGTLSADLIPIKNLTFTSKLGYSIYDNYSYDFDKMFYYNPLRTNDKIGLSVNTGQGLYYQWENYANYLLDIGKNTFTVMAGSSYLSREVKTNNGSTDELISDAENFRYLAYSTSGAIDNLGGTVSLTRSISYFGRLGWSYNNKYNIQATFRADAFDTSKLDEQSRWGYFPSVSAGWTISNEEFFKNTISTDFISSLKLRSSWGINGNVNVLSGYQYANTLSAGYFYMDGTGGIVYGTYPQTQLQNNDLKWEKSTQYDIGLDMRFFKDRLTLTADYYDKNTVGLLINITPALSTGASSQYINAGLINNNGLEFELGWRDRIGKLDYNISGNIATVNNMVVEAPSIISGTSTHAGTTITYFEESFPVWYLRTYKIDHLDETGYPVYKDFDGVEGITDADREYAGCAIPDFTYGISATVGYMGFSLSLLASGAYGNELYYGLNAGVQPTYNRLKYLTLNRWTEDNRDTKIPSAVGQFDNRFYASDGMVFDASYLKIKQIQLGYDIPKAVISKFLISSMKVYVSLEDYFTFTSYPGLDPEAMTNTTAGMAVDKGAYPISKKLSFGVNVTF